jgi:hypothetical protein
MDKSQFKAAVIGQIGVKTEEMLEAAKLDEARNAGSHIALFGAVKKINELAANVDKDVEEGLFNDLGEPLQIAAAIKKYITRASGAVESLAVSAATAQTICQGRIQAMELMVKNLKREHDAEMGKFEARQLAEAGEAEPVEPGDRPRGRTSGVHPGPTAKAKRAEPPPVVPAIPAVKRKPKPKKK